MRTRFVSYLGLESVYGDVFCFFFPGGGRGGWGSHLYSLSAEIKSSLESSLVHVTADVENECGSCIKIYERCRRYDDVGVAAVAGYKNAQRNKRQ